MAEKDSNASIGSLKGVCYKGWCAGTFSSRVGFCYTLAMIAITSFVKIYPFAAVVRNPMLTAPEVLVPCTVEECHYMRFFSGGWIPGTGPMFLSVANGRKRAMQIPIVREGLWHMQAPQLVRLNNYTESRFPQGNEVPKDVNCSKAHDNAAY